MLLHRVLAAALLTTLLAVPCVSVCIGWDATAHARMACCANKSQDDAGICCASADSRANAEVLSGLIVAAAPAPAVDAGQIASVFCAPQILTRQPGSHDRILSDTDRYVLHSVFLI